MRLSNDATVGKFTAVSELWVLDDLVNTYAPDPACLVPSVSAHAPALSADIPCSSASVVSSSCRGSFAPFTALLSPSRKNDEKIARAREAVLFILSSPNACSAWFGQRDPDPASTFRTISYQVDKNGQDHIVRSQLPEGLNLIRQPYVANVTQDGGAYSMITINARGAFYRPQAFVQEADGAGGFRTARGSGELTVGPYAGATVAAQILLLLHEFGHVIDLLPPDGDDMDGSSLQNTNLVLRNCRAEIEARSRPNVRVARVP